MALHGIHPACELPTHGYTCKVSPVRPYDTDAALASAEGLTVIIADAPLPERLGGALIQPTGLASAALILSPGLSTSEARWLTTWAVLHFRRAMAGPPSDMSRHGWAAMLEVVAVDRLVDPDALTDLMASDLRPASVADLAAMVDVPRWVAKRAMRRWQWRMANNGQRN